LQKQHSEQTWVFGYGSLIYKVDFPFLERRVASIFGWERRFWQGSHDHRGTPEAPGRVVTLIPSAENRCGGVAYLVEQDVFNHLDHREKNGYQRHTTHIAFVDYEAPARGVVYVAREGNPAYLGPTETLEQLATHISQSQGPSGTNRDYLLQLADALRALGEHDSHVFALESLLCRQLQC
jgi:cation transport regulator ChaC